VAGKGERHWIGRFARFVVFGGLAAVVNLGVGRALYTNAATTVWLPYWAAVLIATSSGMVVNFGLNYAYNFTYRGRSALLQFRTFVGVAIVGVGLTALVAEGALYVLVATHWATSLALGSMVLQPEFIAHVFAVGVVTFYSFAAHSAFSFNQGIRAQIGRALQRMRPS
jgi:putative flippase GtrA